MRRSKIEDFVTSATERLTATIKVRVSSSAVNVKRASNGSVESSETVFYIDGV